MAHHEQFIRRCFDLARLAGNQTKSNPLVGAVLVYQDKIIGEGFHEYYGGPHAEVNAINSVPKAFISKIPGSTLYISLEPCCTQGKTPACTDLIMTSGIKKVVISALDPNPNVSGRSCKLLRENKVEVITGILRENGEDLIKPFKAHLQNRPYVILKFAQSSDGYFGKRGQQVWISNKYSKIKVHQWRSQCDGILVGSETARIDNPELTTRLVPGRNPLRVVLDDELSLDRSLHLWSDGEATLFIASAKTGFQLPAKKQILTLDRDDRFFQNLLTVLFKKGIYSLIVEGGARTIKSFIEHNLWDEARIIRSNKPLGGGIRAPFIPGRVFHKENLLSDAIEYLYAR